MTIGEMLLKACLLGKYFINTECLNLYEYRAYKTNIGRWINRDPIGENGGVNLYGFVENNTINSIDPFGFCLTTTERLAFVPLPLPYYVKPSQLHQGICEWLAKRIRSFLDTQEEMMAWDRFIGGTGEDIELSDSEIDSVFNSARIFYNELNKEIQECKSGTRNWFNRNKNISDIIGKPWEKALGRVSINLKTSCQCKTLIYNACINDRYDFNPTWFERPFFTEISVDLVWIMQNISLCGWKEFNIKGCKYGFISN